MAYSLRATGFLLAMALAASTSAAPPAPPAVKPAPAAPHPALPVYAVTSTWTIDGDGGWNSIALDEQRKVLYLPRGLRTQAISTVTGKPVAEVPHINGAHGIALVPESNRGFISNTKDGTVTVFDLKSYAVLGTLSFAPGIGMIIYDPMSKRLLVISPGGNSLIPFSPDIDVKTGKADPPIDLQGKAECLVADGQGMVYVTVTDRDEMAVVDTRIMKVATTWAFPAWSRPSDVALDAQRSRLFVLCRGKLYILSAVDGHMIAAPLVPGGSQGVLFSGGRLFVASADGSLTIIGQSAEGQFEVQQTIPTGSGAKDLAIDPKSGEIYLPVADFLGVNGKKPAAGSFKILVLQKK